MRYADHKKDVNIIKKAIKFYLSSDLSQEVCAEKYGMTLHVFRYYYHNSRFMNILREEMENEKHQNKTYNDPEEVMREIFTKRDEPKIKVIKKEKVLSSSSKPTSSKKIVPLSEKIEITSQRPPPAPRSNSANKYKRENSNIDINDYLTKPTPLKI